jgi:hypothetical protein
MNRRWKVYRGLQYWWASPVGILGPWRQFDTHQEAITYADQAAREGAA